MLLYVALSLVAVLVIGRILWTVYARSVTKLHATPYDTLHDRIRAADTGLRVCVIGSGISGIQAMKTCLAEGITPFCLERDEKAGGFWRYSPDDRPSVYRSTHIDTDRDLNSFGDRPYSPDKPMVLHNSQIYEYLQDNIKEFNLAQYVHCNAVVKLITPHDKRANGARRWKVVYTVKGVERTELFDGVLVCTGRHGGGGYVPSFPGLSDFKGQVIHSSHYKHAEHHKLIGKAVAVVGTGNSGLDLICELAQVAKPAYLVARSGNWIARVNGRTFWSETLQDRLGNNLMNRMPWWVQSDVVENLPQVRDGQKILNKYGLKPDHRWGQQHLLVTGMGDPDHTLHDELEKGHILVRKGIERLTAHGAIFTGEEKETPLDAVVMATGYRQAADFVDPKVVDMRFDREGNEVPLYQYMFPINTDGERYDSLGFINFVQSATFCCAELQSLLFVRRLKDLVQFPAAEEQLRHVEAVRTALGARYLDKQQLRVQGGLTMTYYDTLAELIGCYPSVWRLLTERPTAIWHTWFTPWMPLHYRMVGPSRLEHAEQWVEELYQSRYYGKLPDGTPMKGPFNRAGIKGKLIACVMYTLLLARVASMWARGFDVSCKLENKVKDNLWYMQKDGQRHSLQVGKDSEDVLQLKQKTGGKAVLRADAV